MDERPPRLIQLDRTIPFVRAAMDGRLDEAAAILREAEARHGLRWLTVPENRPENNLPDWYERHLLPFLTETHMVLSGGDLQATGCSLLDVDGVDHTPTWRHWGEIVAGWANRHWMPRSSGLDRRRNRRAAHPWEYSDFYSHEYLSVAIAGYAEWRSAVWKVLSLTGNGFLPVDGNSGSQTAT